MGGEVDVGGGGSGGWGWGVLLFKSSTEVRDQCCSYVKDMTLLLGVEPTGFVRYN